MTQADFDRAERAHENYLLNKYLDEWEDEIDEEEAEDFHSRVSADIAMDCSELG